MAVILSQTRKQLRQSIGFNLGSIITSTTTSAGSTSAFTDTELPGGDQWANGRHFMQTSGDNDGSVRIVEDFTGGAKTGRFRTAMGSAVASGVTYELHDKDMPPARYHDFINRAIRTVTRKGAPPKTDLTIHTSRHVRSHALPTALTGIRHIQYRCYYDHVQIDNCDSTWSELVDGDVTASLDYEDVREGSGACKFVLGANLGAGDIIASESVGSLDLSGMTHFEGWIKSTVATSAGDLQFILSTTASAGTETELVSVPALTANTWTRLRVALSAPSALTAIVSVGLKHTTDLGEATVHVDGLEATEDGSETWATLHRNDYRIDRDQRELVITPTGSYVGHSLLKILGVQKPTELTSDTDTCDVDPEFIIAYATSQLMLARADRNATSRQAAQIEADALYARALRLQARMRSPSGVQWIDD